MVINKTHPDLISQVKLWGFESAAKRGVYNYSQASPSAIIPLPEVAISAAGFETTFPAYSITLGVIPNGSAPGATHGQQGEPPLGMPAPARDI